jgi:DNA-binding protein HU-beta
MYVIVKYQNFGKEVKIMNKTELIAAVAAKTGMSKKDAEKAVAATVDAITESLVKGDKVQVSGFGIFEVKTREARVGRNPRTKETIQIPATKLPAFKAAKALKDAVAK